MDWEIEKKDRFGHPIYFIAEHPSGAELHVWEGYTREPSYGWKPNPEVPAGWYFEIKGERSDLNTEMMYEGGKTAAEAQAAAIQLITERIEEATA